MRVGLEKEVTTMTASELQQLQNLQKAGGSDFKEDVLAGDSAGDVYRGFELQSLHPVASVS